MAAELGQLVAEAQEALAGEPLVAYAEKEKLDRLKDITAKLAGYIASLPPSERPVDPHALELAASQAATPKGRVALENLLSKVSATTPAVSQVFPQARLSSGFVVEASHAVLIAVITAVAVPLILSWLGVRNG